jgi:hypothetical protein
MQCNVIEHSDGFSENRDNANCATAVLLYVQPADTSSAVARAQKHLIRMDRLHDEMLGASPRGSHTHNTPANSGYRATKPRLAPHREHSNSAHLGILQFKEGTKKQTNLFLGASAYSREKRLLTSSFPSA